MNSLQSMGSIAGMKIMSEKRPYPQALLLKALV